jgi:hypothetical protein
MRRKNRTMSYYDLLGIIKEDENIPLEVSYDDVIYRADYDSDGEFLCYRIVDENKKDIEHRTYLNENFLECDMFKTNIELVYVPRGKEIINDLGRNRNHSYMLSPEGIKHLLDYVGELELKANEKNINE